MIMDSIYSLPYEKDSINVDRNLLIENSQVTNEVK